MVAAKIEQMPTTATLSVLDSQGGMTPELFEEIARALESTSAIQTLATIAGDFQLVESERQAEE